MTEELDKELEAINKIIKALDGLEPDEKRRVIEYTLTRLGLKVLDSQISPRKREEGMPFIPTQPSNLHSSSEVTARIDIRALKEEKKPRSAIEMATLVAFYLSELSQAEERQSAIGTAEIAKYFKQASFKLPSGKNGGADTLNNAKNVGYLEPAGGAGRYKLTSVGYNLVAFKLPKGDISAPKRPKNQKKQSKK